MTSISGLSSLFAFNPSQVASRMMSAGDTDKSGGLSFSEFSGLDKDSTANATSSDRMSALFDAVDTNADGNVTETELTEFGQKISDAMSSLLQAQEQSGGSGQGTTGGSSSYDPLDTNKDGVVSMMERLGAMGGTDQSSNSTDRLSFLKATGSYQPPALSAAQDVSILA